jgi:hypothetical protein
LQVSRDAGRFERVNTDLGGGIEPADHLAGIRLGHQLQNTEHYPDSCHGISGFNLGQGAKRLTVVTRDANDYERMDARTGTTAAPKGPCLGLSG